MNDHFLEKKARNGQPILSVNGVHLCSTFDPTREAEKWADRQVELTTDTTVILLGLGCGYHAQAIASRINERVVVLEESSPLSMWFYRNAERQFPHLSIHKITGEILSEKSRQIFRMIGSPYTVLVNPYSMNLNPQVYSSWYRFLLGRNSEGLAQQLNLRPEQRPFFDLNLHDGNEEKEFSIIDIRQKIERERLSSFETGIWQALGELVL